MTSRLDALPRDRLLAEFSLWSADLTRLADEMARVDGFVDLYHLDVSDGHFSPALLFFPDLVAALRRRTDRAMHVHLMVADEVLADQARQFAKAGADLVSVHVENATAAEALDVLDGLGVAGGLALKVDTPVAVAAPLLPRARMLTLLGTRIGVKGQGLDERAGDRLREARALVGDRDVILAADGGIREHTVPLLRAAGAGTVVLGSLAFADADLGARIAWVRGMGR